MNKLVNSEMALFADFMTDSWKTVSAFLSMSKHRFPSESEFVSNWMQANWELLVETALMENGNFLFQYGDGSDFGLAVSRVSFPRAVPSHAVVCCSPQPVVDYLTNKLVDLRSGFPLDQLLSFDGKHYDPSPPFDYAHIRGETNQELLFMRDAVNFEVVEWRVDREWEWPQFLGS